MVLGYFLSHSKTSSVFEVIESIFGKETEKQENMSKWF